MIIYDPYGELKKIVDEILTMNKTKKVGSGGKHGKH